ncbi:hypothetical protein N8520_01720, partial [Akkermansiaceae bacterium]|nr:hypothetical protein [Akkermansiaceae bacterium]
RKSVMKVLSSRGRENGFMMAEVILALGIFTIVATSYSKALATLWRTTAYVKEKQVITQIMDSALNEALYLQRLEEGSTEVYIEERDLDLETIVVPLEEMETIDGNFLQNMWQVTVIARFEQDGQDQERVVRGWRYLPLYR